MVSQVDAMYGSCPSFPKGHCHFQSKTTIGRRYKGDTVDE